MSVLIKGLKMPIVCDECWALDESGDYPMCRITGEMRGYNFRVREKRMDRCPLTELPDHGDLIDRDALKADLGITDWECKKCQWGGLFGCKRDDFSDACFFLENAEVIIPAERSEE